jgi:hypothetical protein
MSGKVWVFPSFFCPVCDLELDKIPQLFPRYIEGKGLEPGAKCVACGWSGDSSEAVKKFKECENKPRIAPYVWQDPPEESPESP